MIANLMFSIVDFAARNGITEPGEGVDPKQRARRTGVKGETYAYWYLRREGYTPVARNFTATGVKGEIDIVAYDGPVLAFVEVKTRTGTGPGYARPEEAVNRDKRRNLTRMARHFLRSRRIETAQCRFDVLAIESKPGRKPTVRLYKNAFGTRLSS